ncbi:xylulokinase [Poseidonocella sedimentorum]|uniref:Xylulose kinase n=1 Tax=Poseidonocella sedimentorum TaxID=871652 RepID=A0A1I6EFJ0_9RHOB|nr:xylulokinase [Poseidonocella sedimentorum]SFR16549.1 xylulokinase [Poseidonocella sedimentorum]
MYLGLDLGTSGLKGLLLDADQTVLGEATAPLSVSRPQDGWSEQLPADWLSAASAVIDALAAEHDMSAVRAIGLSGQMHGATLLDAKGNVLRPCILWNDTRSHVEAAEMDADPRWREISGNIVFPGFTAPKIAWVRTHEPEIFAKIDTVLLPKDYLRLWLTGEAVSEMSDSAGTSWLDTGRRDWSDELLALSGLSRAAMPRLIEGSAPSGVVRPELQSRWGFGPEVVVAGGGGDNAASAVGMGVVRPGAAFVSLGTSGVLFAACESYSPDAASAVHSFCHALPDTWHQMGVILSATDSLNWYAGLTGAAPAALDAELGEALQAPGDTVFLPYLGGERTPHNDARIRGALTGLSHGTDRAAGTRAVMEGVGFAVRDCLDALTSTGTSIDSLVAVGGGSRSDYWLKLLATLLDMPVARPAEGDFGAAFGAARLAMLADGAPLDAIATPPPIAATFAPDTSLQPDFAAAHARYRATYRALKEI